MINTQIDHRTASNSDTIISYVLREAWPVASTYLRLSDCSSPRVMPALPHHCPAFGVGLRQFHPEGHQILDIELPIETLDTRARHWLYLLHYSTTNLGRNLSVARVALGNLRCESRYEQGRHKLAKRIAGEPDGATISRPTLSL
jgi:hypothetical protein